jgi:hypothetical protein
MNCACQWTIGVAARKALSVRRFRHAGGDFASESEITLAPGSVRSVKEEDMRREADNADEDQVYGDDVVKYVWQYQDRDTGNQRDDWLYGD